MKGKIQLHNRSLTRPRRTLQLSAFPSIISSVVTTSALEAVVDVMRAGFSGKERYAGTDEPCMSPMQVVCTHAVAVAKSIASRALTLGRSLSSYIAN